MLKRLFSSKRRPPAVTVPIPKRPLTCLMNVDVDDKVLIRDHKGRTRQELVTGHPEHVCLLMAGKRAYNRMDGQEHTPGGGEPRSQIIEVVTS